MIGVFGVNGAGEKRGEYFACANGQYDVVAGFKADHTTWIPGFPVHFQNVSNPTDHITEYWWDLGDGSQTTVENPIHTYENTGNYNVKFAVSDGTKTDTLTRENCIQIIPATEQEILLFEGWNSISSYVSLADSVFENLMSPIIENLVLVKNFDGLYWPEEEINTLNYWQAGAGFSIKLLGDEILVLKGMGHVDKNLQISSGWGFLPVWSTCTIPVTEIVDQFSGSLTVIKEISGNRAYWPAVGVFTLNELEPGRAYLIHLTSTTTVSFPDCEKQNEVSKEPVPIETKESVSDLVKTPFTHLICVENPGKISPENLKAICVFNADGKCCGFSGIQEKGGNTVVAAFGDDPATAIVDGLMEGEQMFFRLITSTGQILELQTLSFDENLPDKASFTINGLSKINGFKTGIANPSVNVSDGIFIYPNPADHFVIIDNLYGKAILEMSTCEGKIVINQQIEGKTRIGLDGFQGGLYFVRIISQTETWLGKIVVR